MTDKPINDGGPAFPFPTHDDKGACGEHSHPGMSLRDWFAGMATDADIQRFLASGAALTFSQARYLHADYMLAERVRKQVDLPPGE